MINKDAIVFDVLSFIENKQPTYDCIINALKEPNKMYSSRKHVDMVDDIIEELIDDEYIEEEVYAHSTHIVDHEHIVYYYALSDTGTEFLNDLKQLNESTKQKT